MILIFSIVVMGIKCLVRSVVVIVVMGDSLFGGGCSDDVFRVGNSFYMVVEDVMNFLMDFGMLRVIVNWVEDDSVVFGVYEYFVLYIVVDFDEFFGC